MFKRRLSHAVLIFLILLCAAGWAESWQHSDYMWYTMSGKKRCGFGSATGSVYVAYVEILPVGFAARQWGAPPPTGWTCDRVTPNHPGILGSGPGYFLGFRYANYTDSTLGIYEHSMDIPYYFFILLFSFALWFVHRRNRQRDRAGFPVQVPGTVKS